MFCIVGVVAVVVRSVPLLLIARLFLSLSFPSHQFRSTYFEPYSRQNCISFFVRFGLGMVFLFATVVLKPIKPFFPTCDQLSFNQQSGCSFVFAPILRFNIFGLFPLFVLFLIRDFVLMFKHSSHFIFV